MNSSSGRGNSFSSFNSPSFLQSFKDPRQLKQYFQANMKDIAQWSFLLVMSLCIFFFFSSGDFSFLLTLSSIVQMFGFILLLYKVNQSRSISGLSRNMLICYAICQASRLLSILMYNGYLPYDSTGDIIYRITETITFLCCVLLVFQSFMQLKATHNWENDTLQWYYFAIPAFVLACLFHPNLNYEFFADVSWTFALYLESLAMLPQINIFRQKGGEIESYTSHYVVSQTIQRIMQLVFWLFSYTELNEVSGKSFLPEYVGYFVLIAQIAQIALTADFLIFYIASIRKGIPLTLPSYVI